MSLTHLTVTNAKPRAKAYKLADADSLYLVVQPNGHRLWRMNYRYLGRQKTLHLGAGPAVSIATARTNRDEARQKLAAGSILLPKRRSRWLQRRSPPITPSRGSPRNG